MATAMFDIFDATFHTLSTNTVNSIEVRQAHIVVVVNFVNRLRPKLLLLLLERKRLLWVVDWHLIRKVGRNARVGFLDHELGELLRPWTILGDRRNAVLVRLLRNTD